MEKFSAYRDPGTGIQPFLTPIPPLGSDFLAKATLPLRLIIGLIRTTLILLLIPIYLVLVPGLCTLLVPLPFLYHPVSHFFTSLCARTALFILGLFWIPEESVTRKRGRGQQKNQSWKPRGGDIIVSNWVSWIELLWLASRFNPIFVLPVCDAAHTPSVSSSASTPITYTPGRRTGTGSANIQSPSKLVTPRISITGFREVSLFSILRLTGQVPPFDESFSPAIRPLETIRAKAVQPLVVLPECTTSNGRGLLRFSSVFHQNVPVKNHQMFVMCVRYDPPTSLAPTLARSIPSKALNPLPHIFTLASSITPPAISIRLLTPSDSPSSPLFMASEVITGSAGEDQLTEACATLISQIGKIKRTGMGWEEKASFLEFYWGQRK
ncbi:hypothetical protein BDZ94DRAFT_1245371 [Collybia nuda]|uniref:Uncharacterized protein n=1 Tax=Collybia nuda TaxID=64659 RepID=A0A9P6CQY5_9AGAR|nr:hypothetical protein BDZ94DRAFT_1245371 [Collybia nuda]